MDGMRQQVDFHSLTSSHLGNSAVHALRARAPDTNLGTGGLGNAQGQRGGDDGNQQKRPGALLGSASRIYMQDGGSSANDGLGPSCLIHRGLPEPKSWPPTGLLTLASTSPIFPSATFCALQTTAPGLRRGRLGLARIARACGARNRVWRDQCTSGPSQ